MTTNDDEDTNMIQDQQNDKNQAQCVAENILSIFMTTSLTYRRKQNESKNVINGYNKKRILSADKFRLLAENEGCARK